MSATVFSGPIVTAREDPYAQLGTPVAQSANQNPDAGPSLFHMATALLDPRTQYTYVIGQAQNPIGFDSAGNAINTAPPTLGWLSATFQVADYAPGTAATFSLAPIASAATASLSITLTTSTQNGVTPNTTMTNAVSGATVTGLWRIDNNPAGYTFGTGTYGVWDPANPPIGRCITITGASGTNLTANTFTVSGYDAYGYPITQVLAGPNTAATVTTGKAFKWVSGITIAATASAGSTFSIGVSDTYGFPMFASAVGYIRAFWSNSNVETSAATTFTAGTATTNSTASDVRGTIGLAGLTISNGARKLQMWQSLPPTSLTVGQMFGVTPA